MRIVRFDDRAHDMLHVGDAPHAVVAGPDGTRHLVPSRCEHRGGPLHLGRCASHGRAIVCPWHGNATPVRRLVRRALPAVRVGSRWSVAIAAEGPVRLARNPLRGPPGRPGA